MNFIRISREARIPAEVYHIKAAGQKNWAKMDTLLARIEAAQKEGLKITADMYTYTAGGTGLDACLPPWTQDGGYPALFKRLRDPATREKIAAEVQGRLRQMGKSLSRRRLTRSHYSRRIQIGETEAAHWQIARRSREDARQRSDRNDHGLDREDESRIGTMYFLMSEENLKKELAKPWVSFGSDEASQAPEGVFLEIQSTSARLRKFCARARQICAGGKGDSTGGSGAAIERDCRPLISDSITAASFKEGMFADMVVFDPATIADHATFEKPHQYAVGVKDVFVNGVPGLEGWRAHRRQTRPRPVGPGQNSLGRSGMPLRRIAERVRSI